MDINFDCPRCGQNISVDEKGAGLKVPCPSCQWQITVPAKPITPTPIEQPKPAPAPVPPKPPPKPHPKPPELTIERRSGWSLFLKVIAVICVVIGVGGCFTNLDRGGPLEPAAFIWFFACVGAAIQSCLFAFLIDVFTDIRWFLKKLVDAQSAQDNQRELKAQNAES